MTHALTFRRAPQAPIILIPSRLAATRLPNKPLAMIAGEAMIVHVWRRAMESGLAPVVVACDDAQIAAVVEKAGGRAVLTRPDHPSGSDRIWEAFQALPDADRYDAVINVQGDEPTLDPHHIKTAFDLLADTDVDIGTLAACITDPAKKVASQVAKPVINMADGQTKGRALYFSRTALPWGDGPIYHHIGLYAYRRDALARFVVTPPAPLEIRERLEQLRALAMGMRIEVGVVDAVPLGVDTPEDLAMARQILEKN